MRQQGRAWKLDLIARVDARLAAPPVPAPRPALAPAAAYTRVEATGRFLHDRETAVLAVTELGSGYWILTPLETPDFTVLVNRGFVPPDRRDPAARPEGQVQGEVTVTGLIRLSVSTKEATPEREGINPFTKEPTIFKAKPARKVVKARPMKALKDAV